MEGDTKVTIGVIAVLVLAVAGVVYYMSRDSVLGVPTQETVIPSEKATTTLPTATTTVATSTQGTQSQKSMTQAIITTNKGVIEIALATDKPATVGNFEKLANSSFYNGIKFHRVIKGFMIQAGDPLSKDAAQKASWGTGGPGYKFNDELTGKETYEQGTLAMANAGPNTNGSQFFIVTASGGAPLPPSYTVFGKVTKGLDVALAIENVATDASDRPVQDVVITSIVVK